MTTLARRYANTIVRNAAQRTDDDSTLTNEIDDAIDERIARCSVDDVVEIIRTANSFDMGSFYDPWLSDPREALRRLAASCIRAEVLAQVQ